MRRRTDWRSQALDALAGGALVLLVLHPLGALISPDGWWRAALWTSAAVLLVGMILRSLTDRGWAPPLAQTAVAVAALGLVGARDTLAGDLVPTPATLGALWAAGAEGVRTLGTAAPPVAASPEVAVVVLAAAVVVLIVVDTVAVTLGRPALAGVPVLVAMAALVANTVRAMPVVWFAGVAALYLLLVGRAGLRLAAGWPSRAHRERGAGPARDRRGLRALARQGVAISLVAVLTAVVLPGLLPPLPTRFVADGLGQGTSGGGGAVTFADTLDLAQDLGDRSSAVTMRYRTDDIAPPPLRITTTATYVDGSWRAETDAGATLPADGEAGGGDRAPSDLEDVWPEVELVEHEVEVIENRLQPPHLALPGRIRRLDLPVPWRLDPTTGAVRVSERPDSYTTVHAVVAPGTALPLGIGRDTGYDRYPSDDRRLAPPDDERAARRVAAFTEATVPRGASKMEAAVAIQNRLRLGDDFSYSLTLERPQETGLDPLSAFLDTRVGYCVQFASLMVFMARHAGIPARLAVGFLPGQQGLGNTWTVRPRDAHAWPELYIDGLGWTRFEPTPSSRSGAAPDYTSDVALGRGATPTAAPTTTEPSPTRSATARPSSRPTPTEDPDAVAAPTNQGPSAARLLAPLAWTLLAATLLAGLLSVLPWLAARERRGVTADLGPAEGEWRQLALDVHDRGGPPPAGMTPREWASAVVARMLGPVTGADTASRTRASEALTTLVRAVEEERYARSPSSGQTDLPSARTAVLREVDAVRDRRERWTTRWAPPSGRAALRRLVRH